MLDARPVAFVIMPFDDDLEQVYEAFLKPALEEGGYLVQRADDLFNQQNILRDIVEAISKSSLIVADLTGLNPNVFYELGVAHALRRPVILLTQSIDEVPFDLKSYRLIAYDTHFSRIQAAKVQLVETARGALEGSIAFGNPVTDFLGAIGLPPDATKLRSGVGVAEVIEDESLGWLDHMVGVEEGFASITAIVNKVASATREIGEEAIRYSKLIQGVNKDNGAGRAARLRFITHEYGNTVAVYGEQLKQVNDEYTATATQVYNGLEYVIAHGTIDDEEKKLRFQHFMEVLAEVAKAANGARSTFTELRESVEGVAATQLERKLTSSSRLVARELDRFIENTDQTVAAVERSREVGERRLRELTLPN